MHCLKSLLRLSSLPRTISQCGYQTTAPLWKGHAKWQNIKHIKMTKDQLRSQSIARQMRNIRLAVQEGNSANPAINPVLKSAIDEAINRNVPASTIKTVLKKLSETPDTSKVHRHLYEGRLFGKVFLVIAVYTENLAQTRAQLGSPFKKHGFSINNTKHLFTERGVIEASVRPEIRDDHFEDDCLNDAVECGAEDVEVHDVAQRQVTFYCEPNEFASVKQKLIKCGYKIIDSECVFFWESPTVKLTEEETKNYQQFKERLSQGVDGFDTVYDNVEDEVVE